MRLTRNVCGLAAALAVLMCSAAARAAEPPFRGDLPQAGAWAMSCFCYGEECPQLDPVSEACVVYHAKQISQTERAVFFLMKGMRVGLGVKYALGVSLTPNLALKSAEAEIAGTVFPLGSCGEGVCFMPATDAQIVAAGSSGAITVRLYGASNDSQVVQETFPGADAVLIDHLVKLPQHP